MSIKKELFKIFQETKDHYELYERVLGFVDKVIENTRGEENSNFYSVIILLLNSINNAGWQERHSEQIKLLHNISNDISDKYEKYLF